MKTFEERYTAWIDGQLAGDALASFEQELDRRAQNGDADAAESDKAQALQLRSLLKEHLSAPALTNTEFFNHQMRERIDAEIDRAARNREAATGPGWKFPAFAWPFARMAGLGAACLFVAGALYYGTVPSHGPDAGKNVTHTTPPPAQPEGVAVVTPAPQPPAIAVDRPKDNQLALLAPTPTPVDLNDEIHVAPSNPGSMTSATPLRYDKANVLWVSGLPYLPNVSSVNPTPAPAPSAAPSVAP